MEEQKKISKKGGTMRLGGYECKLNKGSLTQKAYKKDTITERHRHRYEFNNYYKKVIEDNGMSICCVTVRVKSQPIV